MPTRTVTTSLVILAFVMLASLSACGDDDDSIALADWVAEFDRICVEVGEQSADVALSDEEFRQITEDALAEMRALGDPDEQADDAAAMLEAIEKTTLSSDSLTDDEINELDQQFLDAAEAVGVSDVCITGPQG